MSGLTHKKKKGKSKVKLPDPEDIMTTLANKDYNEPCVEPTEDLESEVSFSPEVLKETIEHKVVHEQKISRIPSSHNLSLYKSKSEGGKDKMGLFDPTLELPNRDDYFMDTYFSNIPNGLYDHIKVYKKVPKSKYQQIYLVYGYVTVGSSNRKDGLMASINQLGGAFEELTVSKDKYVAHLQGLRKAAKSVKSKKHKFATFVRVDADRGTFTSKGKNIFSCASPSQITVDGTSDLRQLKVIGSVGLKMGKTGKTKRTITGEITVYMTPITSVVLYEKEIILPGLLDTVHEAFGTSVV